MIYDDMQRTVMYFSVCWPGGGILLEIVTQSTSLLSGHLEKHRLLLHSSFYYLFIVLFINNYKYIKVTHQSNRGDCCEL